MVAYGAWVSLVGWIWVGVVERLEYLFQADGM